MTATSAHPEVDAAQLVAGRYRVDSWSGAGASATVWLGRDLLLGRPVALKELARGRGSAYRTLREARAAARIDHPGVVRVHDVVLDSRGSDWVVMEALDGCPLSVLLRDRVPLPHYVVTRVGRRLVEAAEEIHRHGLVHRDIKASNVHLGADGRVVLTDFGLAGPPRTTGGAGAGRVAGSIPYLAPEALWRGEYTPASDLYAVGVTLFLALTGRLPFTSWPGDEPPGARLEIPAAAAPFEPVLRGLLRPDARRRLTGEQAATALRSLEPGPGHTSYAPPSTCRVVPLM